MAAVARLAHAVLKREYSVAMLAPEDVGDTAALLAGEFPNVVWQALERVDARVRWEQILEDKRWHTLVGREGVSQRVVCAAVFTIGSKRVCVEAFVVHRDVRRKGFGTKVLSRLCDVAMEDLRCTHVVAACDRNSDMAIAFWRKHGFVSSHNLEIACDRRPALFSPTSTMPMKKTLP